MMNNTTELFTDAEFPMTSDELIERYGDEEIDLSNETLREVLGRTGAETYENREDAEFAVYSGVSERAIGRKGYSDRDPTIPGGIDGHEQLSF